MTGMRTFEIVSCNQEEGHPENPVTAQYLNGITDTRVVPPDFWTIYERDDIGKAKAIGDHPTFEEAYRSLQAIVKADDSLGELPDHLDPQHAPRFIIHVDVNPVL